mgnify:CR=1 FL=1
MRAALAWARPGDLRCSLTVHADRDAVIDPVATLERSQLVGAASR